VKDRQPWINTAGLNQSTVRVCFRRATDRWDGYAGHIIAYFAETVDRDSAMISVWDLDTGEQFEAPIVTMKPSNKWAVHLSTEDCAEARRELETKIGAKVATIKQLKG